MEKEELKKHIETLDKYLDFILDAKEGIVLVRKSFGKIRDFDKERAKGVLEHYCELSIEYIRIHSLSSFIPESKLSAYIQEDAFGRDFPRTLAKLIEKLNELLKCK